MDGDRGGVAAGAKGSRPLEEEAEERTRDSQGDDRCIDGGWADEGEEEEGEGENGGEGEGEGEG